MGVPEHEHVGCLGGREPLVQAAGLSSNRYSLTFRGEPCTRWTSLVAELEAQIERQPAHEVLRALVGVGERPRDRLLAELAVVLGHVRAAAVVELAGDRVVVVAVDRGDTALLDQPADLVRVRAVADEIAAAVDRVDADRVDRLEARLERWQVAVDVGDDRDRGLKLWPRRSGSIDRR